MSEGLAHAMARSLYTWRL